MSTLLLKLAAPLQAWGSSSRFTRRVTEHAPTKSGVIGLLAAASGRRRTDPIEDLLGLRFGVRLDQPGRLERDFQTARTDTGKAFPLTERYYLSDAIFLAGIEGDDELIDHLHQTVLNPSFPLYLGRRSCPPAGSLEPKVEPTTVWDTLVSAPYAASQWWARTQPTPTRVELWIDANLAPEKSGVDDVEQRITETVRDTPISFDPTHRQWGMRKVLKTRILVDNKDARVQGTVRVFQDVHDPFTSLEMVGT